MKKKKAKFKLRKQREKKELKVWKLRQKCNVCGTKKNLTFHHIVKKSFGGSNKNFNLEILCRKCHNKEHKNKLNKNIRCKELTDEDISEMLKEIYKN